MQRAGSARRVRVPALVSAAGALLLAIAGVIGAGSSATAAPSPAVPPTASSCTTAATGVTTCLNTGGLAKAWNPKTKSIAPVPRQVSVSQTTGLSSQVVTVSWKYFSPSTLAGAPYYTTNTAYPVEVLECQTASPTSISQCFGASTYLNGHGPLQSDTNLVQTITGPDSTQSLQYGLLTKADEPSLGCGQGTDCSLLVLPWPGGKNPGAGASAASCLNHSADIGPIAGTGAANPLGSWETNVCAWDSRIVVPLRFVPTADDCPSATPQFSSEGSPLDARAMDLWRTGLCGGHTNLSAGYTNLGDYQARGDVGLGSADVGLTTQTADQPGKPVVYAPITNTSMAVSYYIDDSTTGKPVTGLKLNARLLAKMLTQSYAALGNTNCATVTYPCAPEVSGNPANLFADPEFKKLNPTLTHLTSLRPSASFPTVVFGDNDSTYEITRWIASDPDAAAFLAGKPDPWGMHINTAYLPSKVGTLYPASAFTADDPGATKKVPEAQAACGAANAGGICVYEGMQLTWNPVNGLHNVGTQQVVAKDSGRAFAADCGSTGPAVCDLHSSDPGLTLGARAVFAITSASDAAAYQFPTAQLETRTGSFVGPTTGAIAAAVQDMTTASNGVASLNYATLKDPNAYPLTMPTYAMIPTCGYTTAKISAVGTFVRYVASAAGQHSGLLAGDLAPGYVPLTAAQRALSLAAVTKMSTAACPQVAVPQDTGQGSGGGTLDGSFGSGSGGASTPGGAAVGDASDTGTAAGSSGPNSTVSFAQVKAAGAGFGEIALPLLISLGGALLIGGGPLALFAAGYTVPLGRLRRLVTRGG